MRAARCAGRTVAALPTRGFSLVELLVTIVLAGIVFAALVPVFVSAQKASAGDRSRNTATNIAQDRIEKIRLLAFDQIVNDSSHLQSDTFAGGQFGSTSTPAGSGKTYSVTYSVVSPGQITTSGGGGFGTVDEPMVLLGINDGTSATRAIQLSANAVFTGLVINMDGIVNLDNSGDGTFFIRGAVMSTGDVRFTNNGNVG